MKKLFLLSIGFSIFLLGSCSSEQSVVQGGPQFSSVTGILEVQTIDDPLKGTHLIKSDDGTIAAVRSLSINLSSKKYLVNKVEALGVLNTEDDVFEVSGLTVIEVLSKDLVSADFSEYKNSEFGFKIKYYDDWSVDENPNEVVFSAAEQDGVSGVESVKISNLAFNYQATTDGSKNYSSPLEAYFMEEMGVYSAENLTKIGPDLIDAVKMEIDNGPVEYTLYRSGLIYKIQFFPSKNPGYDDEKRIFNEMVAEFQFIGFDVEDDPLSVPVDEKINAKSADLGQAAPVLDIDLTYFESLPYSFRGVYPASWYYAGTLSSTTGVFHHYGFSTESVTDSNELLSLEVIDATLMKPGSKMTMNGHVLDLVDNGNNLSVYTNVADRYFRVSGPSKYKDLILNMASGITHIDPVTP